MFLFNCSPTDSPSHCLTPNVFRVNMFIVDLLHFSHATSASSISSLFSCNYPVKLPCKVHLLDVFLYFFILFAKTLLLKLPVTITLRHNHILHFIFKATFFLSPSMKYYYFEVSKCVLGFLFVFEC